MHSVRHFRSGGRANARKVQKRTMDKKGKQQFLLVAFGVALYAGGGTGDALRQGNAYELLRSAYIASVLALGGALVLDLDLRRGKER